MVMLMGRGWWGGGGIDTGVTDAVEYINSLSVCCLCRVTLLRCSLRYVSRLLQNNDCSVPGFVISPIRYTVAANTLIKSTIGAAATSPIVSLSNSKQHRQLNL